MTNKEWAEDLVSRQACLFHVDAYAVGQAKKYYDGVEDCYISRVNGEPVKAEVLELESGHALLANPEKWVELTKAEIRYFGALQEGFRGLIIVSAQHAKTNGVELDKGIAMLISILRSQLAALEAG